MCDFVLLLSEVIDIVFEGEGVLLPLPLRLRLKERDSSRELELEDVICREMVLDDEASSVTDGRLLLCDFVSAR